MKKWNPQNHEYETYTVPETWNVKQWAFRMDEVINCARCGAEICYGDSYTSLQIHDALGIGYAVCGDCLHKEADEL